MAKELEAISLKDIIPASIAEDKNVGALRRAIDPQLQEVSRNIREAFIVSRIHELPENVIDLLAWQWHVDFYEPELSLETKRALVLESIRWHRKKGTKAAIVSALEKLGFVPTIKEWYEPELRTEPHTFSVRGYYKDDHINVDFLGDDTDRILTRIIELTKPARSRLLKLVVAPIPIDMTKHICRWDWCNWEHVELKKYYWGLPIPSVPVTFDALDIIGKGARGFLTLSDCSLWDVSTWGHVPYRFLQTGRFFRRGFFTELESDDYLTWQIPYSWLNNDWSAKSSFLRPTGAVSFRPLPIEYKADDSPFVRGLLHLLGLVFELGTCWDYLTWPQHYTWAEAVQQLPIRYGFTTGFEASFSWDKHNAPKPSWSEHQTWEYADTWTDSTERFGSWEVGTWKEVA